MTVTDSHSAAHSALHSQDAGLGDPNASAHAPPSAPARVDRESSAHFEHESADTDSDENWDVWAWILETITPPDIWNHGSRPLKDMWAYASRGEWTSPTGVFRTLGKAYYLLFAMPIISVLEYVKWIVERPSRLAAAAVLLFVLAQFPPVSWLI